MDLPSAKQWIVALLLLTGSACTSHTESPVPAPGKDEAALIDGQPLSLTTVLDVRDQLRARQAKDTSLDSALSIAIDSILLAREAERRGMPLKSGEALDSLLKSPGGAQAASPEVLRLRSAATIIKNERVLEKIR